MKCVLFILEFRLQRLDHYFFMKFHVRRFPFALSVSRHLLTSLGRILSAWGGDLLKLIIRDSYIGNCGPSADHGLTDACSKILTQAGVQQQGLAALSQAFKQAATIREVRSRRQALLRVFKRILTEATSQHEKNDKSRGRSATQAGEVAKDAPATKDANRHPKHEDSPACRPTSQLRPTSQRIDVPKQQPLPAKWAELKKEYDVRTGCGLQVDWDTICRETNASAACYGYLAGQLTNNIQATAQDKAAQLRQAVRDGWKQYREPKRNCQSDITNANQQQQNVHNAGNFTYWHVHCTSARAGNNFGWSERGNVKQIACLACKQRFYTKDNKEAEIVPQHAKYHPWFCHGSCQQFLRRSDFTATMLSRGGKNKLCAKCKG